MAEFLGCWPVKYLHKPAEKFGIRNYLHCQIQKGLEFLCFKNLGNILERHFRSNVNILNSYVACLDNKNLFEKLYSLLITENFLENAESFVIL